MGNLNGVKDVVDAELEGRVRSYQWRKVPTTNIGNAQWFDLGYSPGNPAPNYYIGSIATATPLKQSTDGGIFHGAPVAPEQMFLRKALNICPTATPLPTTLMLLDYLMFYPFIDESTTDEQFMTNTQTLPRYTDGEGVQVMAVSVAGRTGGKSFFFTYTNQDGVSGRISQTCLENTTSTNGVLVTTGGANVGNQNPFIGLQQGDTGVRSIESVTMLGADVGLFTLVLVKPIFETVLRETTAPTEVDLLVHKEEMPRIYDDAFLNYIMLNANSGIAAAVFIGNLKFIWK